MVWWFTVYLAGTVAREIYMYKLGFLLVVVKFHCVLGGRGGGG